MKHFKLVLWGIGVVALAKFWVSLAAAGTAANNGTFVVFDVPGSTCLPIFASCTQASAINSEGAVVGTYADANQAIHGFLRMADGSVTNIDPPGAACPSAHNPCSVPASINPDGVVAGSYFDANFNTHAYLRARNGTFTTIDAPGGLNGTFIELAPPATSINPEGSVTGAFFDASYALHGFIRYSDGRFVTFDAPGAVNGTIPISINPEGAITGVYYDANTGHGFLRARDGSLTAFNPPGSIYTQANGIDPAGEITGFYQDSNFLFHGFLRLRDGTFKSFDGSNSKFDTQANGINPAGVITGTYQSPAQPIHGFVRTADGTLTSFDPALSTQTEALAINPAGAIAGWYIDVYELGHGFIRLPPSF